MTEPKVSVIVPVYNVATYLPQCLDSILAQTLQETEIIVVDDGSTDNSPQICDEYAAKDKRIQVIHQKNQGQSSARNKGMALACGKYIAFVDSDDWIEPTMLQKLYEAAEKDKSNVAVCHVFCTSNKKVRQKKYWPYAKDCVLKPKQFYKYFLIAPCWPCNKIYRRAFLQKKNITFIEGVFYEDVPFFTEIFLQLEQVSFVADYLYNYRTGRSGSTTTEPSAKHLDIVKVQKIVEQLLQKHNASALLQSNFEYWVLWNYVWMYRNLPAEYHEEALRQIAQLPKNMADKILERLNTIKGKIFVFGLPLLRFKRTPSRFDILLWKLPIISVRQKTVK